MTALGAALVYPLELVGANPERQQVFLDSALGASSGVMLAASFFSLLLPAIQEADKLWPGYDWLIASLGFLSGGLLMVAAEMWLPDDVVNFVADGATGKKEGGEEKEKEKMRKRKSSPSPSGRGRRGKSKTPAKGKPTAANAEAEAKKKKSWKRILLLVLAISLHNAPEGGAVGVAFGALADPSSGGGGDSADAACVAAGCNPPDEGMTFASARTVAIGIGLQNFPEGLAVSLPLRREGCSLATAFFWGQLSGMVEIASGFLGAYLVQYARVALPVALSSAAGAMVYVVCAELIPEANGAGNVKAVNAGIMIGFVVMMAMDVALG
jgi:zinc transporter 11